MKVTVVTVLMVLTVFVVVMMVNMKLLMLIRVGSEAMIGYSPSVPATDPGTEEPIWYRSWYRGQPTALKGAHVALSTSKYSQY